MYFEYVQIISYEFNFHKIKIKTKSIDVDGCLMGEYVNGQLKIVNDANFFSMQRWDYIIKTNGQILVGTKHSWLSKGEDVLAAGELKYNNKKLFEINNRSGHYLPSKRESSNFLKIFRQAGVEINDVKFTILKISPP